MKNFLLAKAAYYMYLERDEGTETNLLSYIKERIIAEKEAIEKLVEITHEEIDLDKIIELFNVEEVYKSSKKMTMVNDFISGVLVTPKGVIVKEETTINEVVKYYITALNTRNAVIIKDINYNEASVKNLILLIFHEAMKKFEVDEKLIQLLPNEGIDESEVYNFEENRNNYVYLEDKKYIGEKNEGCIVLEGNIDDVREKINIEGIANGAIIYTSNKDKAYKFLNRVNAKNVFVNAGIVNAKEAEVSEWVINKNVIYPMPQKLKS